MLFCQVFCHLLEDMLKRESRPGADLYIASTPCQDFSMAGRQQGPSCSSGLCTQVFLHCPSQEAKARMAVCFMPQSIELCPNVRRRGIITNSAALTETGCSWCQVVLMENVEGLPSRHPKDVKKALAKLRNAGYVSGLQL